MLDRHALLRHGQAGVLFLATVFLALSLAGYDPADAPGSAAEPPNQPPANPCGPAGAALAHMLFNGVGHGAWLVLLAMTGLVVLVLRRHAVPERLVRSIGFALLLTVIAALIGRFAGRLQPSPPIGSGGYLGALIATLLESHFGLAGMILILGATGFVGLALCHDVLLVWPAQDAMELLRIRVRRRPSVNAPGGHPIPAPHGATALMLANPGGALAAYPEATLLPATNAMPVVHRAPAPPPMPPVNGHGVIPNGAPAPARSLPPVSNGAPAQGYANVPAPMGNPYFHLPSMELLEPSPPFPIQEHEAKIQTRAMLLEKTLLEFGCQVRVVQIDTGPVITQFEIELEAGLRVAKINSVANDLAIALAVPSVRIVSPIPGKTTVGIEVPNDRRAMVRLRDVIEGVREKLEKFRIPLFLGKDVKGLPLAYDLADMPHLLIAGRTGTGKSVCLNAMILSILMTKRPDEVKLILIDPKMVELSQFKRIPHLMHPVVTDMKKAESLLSWACDKMDERYGYLARAGVRNITAYNQLGAEEIYNRLRPEDDNERARIPTYMPYIVIIADEMADLMMTAAKEVETHIVRLAQKARAVGMHLILATQKPTVDVVTGLIKGNLPARIAFQVSNRSDSRVVLDEMGADKLLGNGDMLFLIPGTSHIVRAQGTYVGDGEVNGICDHLAQYPVEFSKELMQMQVGGGPGGKERGASLKDRDEMYEPAIEIVVREGRGSCSLLQRALGIGYGRAARLIDFMAEDGIVGEFKSGSAREVLYTWEEWEALKNDGEAPGDAA